MTTKNSAKLLLAGAAFVGLLGGTAVRVHAASSDSKPGLLASDSDKDKHGCKGKNDCKGKGGCKSSNKGCHGKNSCKGKGGCATDGSHA